MLGAAILVCAIILAPAAASGAPPFTVKSDREIGSLQVVGGTLGDAIASFGQPSSIRLTRDDPPVSECRVRWARLGIRALFLSTDGVSACSASGGNVFRMALADKRWRTKKGLRIGNTVKRLRAVHPNASFHRRQPNRAGGWHLVRRPDLGGGVSPTMHALVRSGKVVRLVVTWPGGAD